MRRNHPNGYHPMDPRRELQESLPLCHPNDDYLKDFMPMSCKHTKSIVSFDKKKIIIKFLYSILVQDDQQPSKPSNSKEGVLTWV